jgi:hypothetical protein
MCGCGPGPLGPGSIDGDWRNSDLWDANRPTIGPPRTRLRVGESAELVVKLKPETVNFSSYDWLHSPQIVTLADGGCTEVLPDGTRECRARITGRRPGSDSVVFLFSTCLINYGICSGMLFTGGATVDVVAVDAP